MVIFAVVVVVYSLIACNLKVMARSSRSSWSGGLLFPLVGLITFSHLLHLRRVVTWKFCDIKLYSTSISFDAGGYDRIPVLHDIGFVQRRISGLVPNCTR
jgi:hypothetical protein